MTNRAPHPLALRGNGPATAAVTRCARLRRVWELLVLWQARASSRARLAALDDRMLRDMGIRREDALHETRKPFWRP